jgi:hypothetical protein
LQFIDEAAPDIVCVEPIGKASFLGPTLRFLMRKSVLTSVEPERAARGACPHVMSEAGRSEGSEHRLVLKSCTRRRGGVDVCSASIDGGLVCCKRSHLPVQPVQLRDAVDRPVIPATAIDQLRATESPADDDFQ